MTTNDEQTEAAEPATAPRSAAAAELRELALIMRHVEHLSAGSKIWLRDRIDSELELLS